VSRAAKPRIARAPGPNGGAMWVCWSVGGCGSYGATPEAAYDEWKKARDAQRSRNDFDFMVMCHAKGDPAMYELFRDRGAR
jgi:hypothetical protein